MDRKTDWTPTLRRLTPLAALLTGGTLLLAAPPASAGEKETKLERQIGVMARTIDDMLVDSPNFLVAGKEVTEGFEVDDYGAIFFFEASLTGMFWDEGGRGSLFNFWPMGEKRHIVIRRGDGDEEEEIILGDGKVVIKDGEILIDENGKTKKLKSDKDIVKIDKKSFREKQAQKYEAAKEELVKTVMDYGDLLKALPAGQTIRVIARFDELDLPEGKEVRRLSVKASIDDLRAFGDGRLSESAMRAKMEIKES